MWLAFQPRVCKNLCVCVLLTRLSIQSHDLRVSKLQLAAQQEVAVQNETARLTHHCPILKVHWVQTDTQTFLIISCINTPDQMKTNAKPILKHKVSFYLRVLKSLGFTQRFPLVIRAVKLWTSDTNINISSLYVTNFHFL